MKGKFLLSAVALFLPVSVAAQGTKPAAADAPEPLRRYEVFAGADYSGANQIKSASALIGFNAGASAKLVKWFGGTVDLGDYMTAATNNGLVKPTQTTFLAGPEFYIPADSITGFVHVLFGGAHTGNIVGGKPDISFAYGIGGGFEYAFSKRLSLRISGDGISSSFVADPNNRGYSPHSHANARASGGLAWHF